MRNTSLVTATYLFRFRLAKGRWSDPASVVAQSYSHAAMYAAAMYPDMVTETDRPYGVPEGSRVARVQVKRESGLWQPKTVWIHDGKACTRYDSKIMSFPVRKAPSHGVPAPGELEVLSLFFTIDVRPYL